MIERLRRLPLAVRVAVMVLLASIVIGLTCLLAAGPNRFGWAGLLAGAVGITVASLAFGLGGRMFCSDAIRSPMRNYNWRIAIAMTTYAVVLIGTMFLYLKGWTPGPFGYGLAALPAVPIAAVFAILGLYLKEETDEFARRSFAEACLLGAGATFVEATFWGFLETFGKVQHLPMYWASIAFFAQFGIATALVKWRYR